jgi:hypothetical protein
MFYFVNIYDGGNILSSNMPESYKKTLCSLALEGESTQYSLRSATKLNYASVHEAVEGLIALNLVTETRREPGPGPVPKRFFSLTLKGLAMALMTEDLSKHMNNIAEKWDFLLPLLLGKWVYFESVGVGEELRKALMWLSGQIISWGIGGVEKLRFGQEIDQLIQFDSEKWVMEQFFVYVFTLQTPRAKILWLKAFRADRDLRQWAIQSLTQWFAESTQWIKINKRTLRLLQMPSEPDWSVVVNNLRWHFTTEEKE